MSRFTVTVFCGSSPGFDPVYVDAARAVGTAIGTAGMALAYGGGHVGLMGAVADAAVAAGADRYVYKVFSEQQRRGKLVVRQNNRRGRNRKIVLARISVGGDGEISVIGDSNEPTSITVTGKVERDENQPAGLERGYILDLV